MQVKFYYLFELKVVFFPRVYNVENVKEMDMVGILVEE